MRILRSIFLLILLTAVMAGCKKENNDPQPVVGLENTFMIQRITTGKASGDTTDNSVYKYDSLNRICEYNNMTVFYNSDGTISKIRERMGDNIILTYDAAKRIKRLIISDYYSQDTVDFFYSNKEKPDYIHRTFRNSTITFHYNEQEMVDTMYTVCELSAFNNKEVRHWQNGNMVKSEIFTEYANVYHSIDIEYDSKPCLAETMHLSKDLLLLSEYDLLFWSNRPFVMKNNTIKETYFDKFDNTTTIYPHTITEYNSKGLPIKVDEGDYIVEYVYEER